MFWFWKEHVCCWEFSQIHNRNKHLKGDKFWQMWRLRLQQVQWAEKIFPLKSTIETNIWKVTSLDKCGGCGFSRCKAEKIFPRQLQITGQTAVPLQKVGDNRWTLFLYGFVSNNPIWEQLQRQLIRNRTVYTKSTFFVAIVVHFLLWINDFEPCQAAIFWGQTCLQCRVTHGWLALDAHLCQQFVALKLRVPRFSHSMDIQRGAAPIHNLVYMYPHKTLDTPRINHSGHSS